METIIQLLIDTLKVFLTAIATGFANHLITKHSNKRKNQNKKATLRRRKPKGSSKRKK